MNPYLFIYQDKKFIRIHLAEILYVVCKGRYCKIVTEKETYLPRIQLNEIERYLPSEHFTKVNRGVLIPINRVEWFNSDEIVVGGHRMGISDSCLKELKHKISIAVFREELKSDSQQNTIEIIL